MQFLMQRYGIKVTHSAMKYVNYFDYQVMSRAKFMRKFCDHMCIYVSRRNISAIHIFISQQLLN